MKKYTIVVTYKSQQIKKMCCAKNVKDAAELLGVNTYFINKYGYKTKIDTSFDGIISSFDSGLLWEKEKSLINVEMPLERMKSLIDWHKDPENKKFRESIGID